MPDLDLDAQIEALLNRSDWWQLPLELIEELERLLMELIVQGLDIEAGRIQALQLGDEVPAYMALAWDITDPRVIQLVERHAAEMVVNVNNGTKMYLRQLLKEGIEEGLGTTEMIERIQRDLFGLPYEEAIKFPRTRLKSIISYETNKAMSGAANLLRQQLGLKNKQWFTNEVSPCELCLANQAQGIVGNVFQYEGVFGAVLIPPSHPHCKCVVIADEAEVRSLGTAPMVWPMMIKAILDDAEDQIGKLCQEIAK